MYSSPSQSPMHLSSNPPSFSHRYSHIFRYKTPPYLSLFLFTKVRDATLHLSIDSVCPILRWLASFRSSLYVQKVKQYVHEMLDHLRMIWSIASTMEISITLILIRIIDTKERHKYIYISNLSDIRLLVVGGHHIDRSTSMNHLISLIV